MYPSRTIDVSSETYFLEIRYDNAAKVSCFYPLPVYKMNNNTLCYLYLPLNESSSLMHYNGRVTLSSSHYRIFLSDPLDTLPYVANAIIDRVRVHRRLELTGGVDRDGKVRRCCDVR